MRTPAQRGPIGNWLRDERLARGWSSAAQVRGHLERAGIHVAASVYAEWESGTRLPSERHLDQLQEFYGSKPAQDGGNEVAAAIRDQTKAITDAIGAQTAALAALTRALEGLAHEQRAGQGALTDELGHVMQAVKALRPQSGTAAEAPAHES